MNQGRNATKAILKVIARGEDRSPLFWWMVENHDRIAGAAGKRIHWKGVCSEAAARGLTDVNGNPASIGTARETWRKARIAVAEARERDAATPRRVGATPPSRLPKDWRPASAPGPAGVPAVASNGGGREYDPRKAKAHLDRILKERSGRSV